MLRFESISLTLPEWGGVLSDFHDKNVFQTPEWLEFLCESVGVEPVFAVLKNGDEILGYLAGAVVKKFGLRIFASPFRGWSTPYMGFNLRQGVSRRVAIEALEKYAFSTLRCIHLEIVDHAVTEEDVRDLGFTLESRESFELDLSLSEENLFKGFTSSCRRNTRLGERAGVVIEEASDASFADEYIAQLHEVFAKQQLIAPFGLNRVQSIQRLLGPTGNLLCLRARDTDGRCIATGVFPAFNKRAYFWGGASWKDAQKLYPNCSLFWYAIRYWKRKGMERFNFVGTMDFKKRFGGELTPFWMIAKSKYRLIAFLREKAPVIIKGMMSVRYKIKNFGRNVTVAPKSDES